MSNQRCKNSNRVIYRRKPYLSRLKIFGTLGYVYIPKKKRSKMDAKELKCVILGMESSGFIIEELDSKRRYITPHVTRILKNNP